MTLKYWAAAPPPPPCKLGALESTLAPSVETLLAQTHTRSGMSGLHTRSPSTGRRGAALPRTRSQSSNWDPSKSTGDDEMEDAHGEDAFDPSSATIPAPAHAMPALWVSGRRRQHARRRLRRRSASENCSPNLPRRSSSTSPDSTSSTMSSTLSTTLGSSTLQSTLSSSSLVAQAQAQAEELARRVNPEEDGASLSQHEVNRRVRIVQPEGSSARFGGWVRGQAAEVQWQVLDASVKSVRIDVCNVAWNVPTTIAHCVPNDGAHRWRRVYWGMPIAEGYYVNIYDVTEQPETGAMPLLAQSDRFAVIK